MNSTTKSTENTKLLAGEAKPHQLDGLNLRRLRELNALRGDETPIEAQAILMEALARVARNERGKQTDLGHEEWEQCFGSMVILLDRLAAEQGVDLAKAVARQFNAQSMEMKQGHFLVKNCVPGNGCEWE